MDLLSFSFWIGPIVGAIIGLITNGIAIRMLFRPLEPVYIGRFQLPFTPGLIPKEQKRIAHSIGEVVSKELFSPEILERGLISNEIDAKIRGFIEKTTDRIEVSKESVRDVAYRLIGERRTIENIDWVEKSVAAYIYKKAVLLDIGTVSVTLIAKELDSRMSDQTGMLKLLSEQIIDKLKDPIVEVINTAVEKNFYQIVYDAIEQEGDHFLDQKISDLYEKYSDKMPEVEEWIINRYHEVVRNNLAQILEDIHMDRLVEERVNSYSPAEMEKLILTLMKKELGAIIYLGGFLGFIMGFVMNFIH